MYINDFNLVAIFLSIMVLYLFHVKQRLSNSQARRFSRFLWLLLLCSLSASVYVFLANRLECRRCLPVVVADIVYRSFYLTVFFSFTLYLLTVAGVSSRNKFIRFLFIVPCCFGIALVLLFRVYGYLVAEQESAVWFLYPVPFFYALVVFYAVVRPGSILSLRERLAAILSLVMPFVACLLEILFSHKSLLSFAMGFSSLVLLLLIQAPRDLYDAVSGLYSRTAFFRFIRRAFNRSESCRVLLIHAWEIARFQGFVDSLLYEKVIQKVSAYIDALSHKRVVTAMLDPGFFAVILEKDFPKSTAGELALKMVERSSGHWDFDGMQLQFPVHVAILECPNDCSTLADLNDLIEQFRLFPVQIGNRHVFFGRDFKRDQQKREAAIAYALKHLVSANRVELLLQPVYSVKERKITAAEVLLSIQMPDGEKIHQSEVIRMAEKTGLAHTLALQMLEWTCSWLAKNHDSLKDLEQVQVRLLDALCLDLEWPLSVTRILKTTNVDPAMICLEITETTVVNVGPDFGLNMEMLKGQGVRFALDDYGSGYTHFEHIVHLPFSTVKFDKQIIYGGLDSLKGTRLLAGSIAMFKRLERTVIGEGVETAEQADILREMGCDYLQGYWYGRPSSSRDFPGLLLNGPV